MRPLPAGAIVIPSGHEPRYHAFYGSLIRLLPTLPLGCGLKWTQGPDIAFNINHGIEGALVDNPSCEWIWLVGDDHTFEPDIIERLWRHDLAVVAPYVLRRNVPHPTVMFDENGKNIRPEPLQRGLMRVGSVGGAGMLIRRQVIDKIQRPWFGLRGTERQGEDLFFCDQVTAAGMSIHVDLDTWMGHITSMEVWPEFVEGRGWACKYRNSTQAEVV
jgi:hypothetical protein